MFPVVAGFKGFKIFSANVLYWDDILIFFTDEG